MGKSTNGTLWWKAYLREKAKLEAAQKEIAKLKAELEAIHERERREQEELDSYCDKLEAELLNPDVLQAIQQAGR